MPRNPSAKVSRDEARDFYLEIFDSFAVEVYDKGDKRRGERPIDNRDKEPVVAAINARLSASSTDQTIVRSNVNGEYDVWQCWHTHDDWSREQAEAAFDEAWPTTEIEIEAPVLGATGTTGGACKCGCAVRVASNRHYLPGHDARHAGQVARAILALPADAAGMAEGADLLLALPTQALRDKAMAQVERGNAKTTTAKPALRKATTDPAEGEIQDGYVTVGGQAVPAQRFMVGERMALNINDAQDGSGDWLDSEGYNRKSQAYWLKRFYVAKV